MPQMAPMLWSVIYLLPLTLIITIFVTLNFTKSFSTPKHLGWKISKEAKNWLW